ncbi:choice-of-anchor M domain-containing protein [Kitasatospora sp. NPDC004799]|uniref:choice-of-anchor M domain-containing protein n=1 Tax=Kitasatospora sp. NPDC004799 TaxID=3154460 RepID=UPI0033A49025
MITRSLTLAGTVAAVLACGALTASAAGPVNLSTGHVDVLDVEYADGVLGLHVHDESVVPDVEYDPAAVVLQALPASQATVPSGSQYAFLGAPGAATWILPQLQSQNLLWPGISGEHLATGVFQNDRVTVRLTGAQRDTNGDGVGDTSARFAVYSDNGGSITKYFDSSDGVNPLVDARTVLAGSHDHANWAFGAAGDYILKFQAVGTLANGTGVSSAVLTYRFHVG